MIFKMPKFVISLKFNYSKSTKIVLKCPTFSSSTTSSKSSSKSSTLTILNDLTERSNAAATNELTQRLNRSSRMVMWQLFYSGMRLASSAIAKECAEFMYRAYQDGRWLECCAALCLTTLCFWFFIWK